MNIRRALWAVGGTCVALVPAILYAFSTGPDARYTAAPGDSPLACASVGCHTSINSKTGGPINAAGGKVVATFSTGSTYTPGVPLTITVTVSDPVNKQFGFQMTARLDSNQTSGQAGSFTDVPNVAAVLCDFPFNNFRFAAPGKVCPANSQVQFMEHTAPRSGPFTFTWTPPATDVGPVHFYVAGNAVNFDGQADALDHVYTASYTLTPAATVNCVTSTPVISRVITASAFGGFPNFGAGSWLEIYGSNFTTEDSRIWGGADFAGSNAPTSLDRVSVSINGKAAFVYFMNPGQINVQAPADTATGNVPVTVTNCALTSSPIMFQKIPVSPGMLAPDSFLIGGKQYLVALFADNAYVLNTNAIPGVTSRPAKPGDNITTYGIGFGDTTPANSPGVIVGSLNQITAPVTISFDSTPANVSYKGLAPGFVGLYQFNLTVPNVSDGDHAIKITLDGTPLQQSFFLTVHK